MIGHAVGNWFVSRDECARRTPHDDGAYLEFTVPWIVLVVSGLFESVWAVALGQSKGFSRATPTIVFCSALVVSMGGLAVALRTIPVGTGYAIWTGVGALGAATYGMAFLGDPITVARITCLTLIVAGAVGLKVLH